MNKDELVLSEESRSKLDGIVQKMIANKESDENIQFVVGDFKSKYGEKKNSPKNTSLPNLQEQPSPQSKPLQTSGAENKARYDKYNEDKSVGKKTVDAFPNWVDRSVVYGIDRTMSKPITLGEETLQQGVAKSDMGMPSREEKLVQADVTTNQNEYKILEKGLSGKVNTQRQREKELANKLKISQYIQKLIGDSGNVVEGQGEPIVEEDIDLDIYEPIKLEIDELQPERVSENANPELRDRVILKNSKEARQKTYDFENVIKPKISLIQKRSDAKALLQKTNEEINQLSQDLNTINDEVESDISKARSKNKLATVELGIPDSFALGITESVKAIDLAKEMASGNDEKVGQILEDAYIQNRLYGDRKTSQISQMLGGQAVPLGVSFATAIASGGNPFLTAGVTSGVYGGMGAGMGAIQSYIELRNQGKSQAEAREVAKEMALVGGAGGVAEGVIGTTLQAGKIATKVLGLNKGFAKTLVTAMAEAKVDATVAMGVQAADNLFAISKGIDRKVSDGVLEQGAMEVAFGAGYQVLFKGASKLTPKTYKKLVNQYAKFPTVVHQQVIDKAVKDGVISASEAKPILDDIVASNKAQEKLKGVEIPEKVENEVIDLQTKIDELEAQKKDASPAILPAIEAKIEALSSEIQIKAAIPLTSKERTELNKLQTAKDSNADYDKVRLKELEARQEAVQKADEEAKAEEAKKVVEDKEKKEQKITFENAKEGDVVTHNGKQVTIVSRGKSRGGSDIVTVKQSPKTKAEIKADALQNVFNKVESEYKKSKPTWADIEANHPSEVRAEIDRLTALENSRTATFTMDAEQWNSEVEVVEAQKKTDETVEVELEPNVTEEKGGAMEVEKPTPQKVNVLGKEVNMYNDYIPSKIEDVEPNAMYVFNANSKDEIPSLLQDIAYANKRDVNGVKTENWHASISGDELLKLYPSQSTTAPKVEAVQTPTEAVTEAEVVTPIAPDGGEVANPLADVESTAKAMKEITAKQYNTLSNKQKDLIAGDVDKTAQAYHKAKADGTNPELVQAVEQLLGKNDAVSDTKTDAVNEPKVGERVTPTEPIAEEKTAPKEEATETPKTKLQTAKEKLAEAKRKRDELAKKKGNLGAFQDSFDDAKEQAKADRELFDAYVEVAKEYISEVGGTIQDWAKEIGEEVNDNLQLAWDVANGKQQPPPREKKVAEIKGDGVKKTVLTYRVYEGEIRDDVRKEIEKYGLDRLEIPHQEAENIAKKLIEEVGLDLAYQATINGDITGGTAAEIYAAKIRDLNNQLNSAQTQEEIERLGKDVAAIYNKFSNVATEAGQFGSQLGHIYDRDRDLGYNYEKKVKEYKDANNGEISPEIEAKFKDLDEQIKALSKQVKEAEAKVEQAREQQAFDDIKASIKRNPSDNKRVRAKRLMSEGLDDIAQALGVQLMASGTKRASVVTGLTKIGQSLILNGEATIENVGEKVREFVKAKFGDKFNFDDFATDFDLAMLPEESSNKLRIPNSYIRDLVEGGIDTIEDLVKAIQKDYGGTDREVRDAITGYGKTFKPRDEIANEITRLKDIGRMISALEDIEQGKRPLRSGQQREAPTQKQREMRKKVREALKDLGIDEATMEKQLKTALDAAKTRLRNQIEDMEAEIAKGEQVPKSARTMRSDEELEKLKRERDAKKKEYDEKFKDEAYKEAKRLEMTKRATERRIEFLKNKIKNEDFDKKPKKLLIEDTELTKLRAEKIRLQDEYDKEIQKAKLRNRTKAEVWKDRFWEGWGITRALSATGEWSFVGVQGLTQLIANPKNSAKAFGNAWRMMWSEKATQDFLDNLRAQDFYPILKQSKLAITEPNAKITAREELFNSQWTNIAWGVLGSPLKLKSEGAYEGWLKLNPFKALERASVGYLDTIRVLRFLDGVQMLEMKKKNFNEHQQAYKDMADVVNTLTGRASIGKIGETYSEELSRIFFSPRNWASGLKTTILLPVQVVRWQMDSGAKELSVANKIALGDLSKMMGLTTAMVMLAAAGLESDDDEETSVGTDPTSSDFGKIIIGDRRIDPWGGKIQQIVFASRIYLDSITKKGVTKNLGQDAFTATKFDLSVQQATNKLSPSAKLLVNYMMSGKDKEGVRRLYGEEYTFKNELAEVMRPIYLNTVLELLKDDPKALDGMLLFYGFFGGGIGIQKDKPQKQSSTEQKSRDMPL